MLNEFELLNLSKEMVTFYGIEKSVTINITSSDFMFNVSNKRGFKEARIDVDINAHRYFDSLQTVKDFYGADIEVNINNTYKFCILHEIGHCVQFLTSFNEFIRDFKDFETNSFRIFPKGSKERRIGYMTCSLEDFANRFAVDHINEWL